MSSYWGQFEYIIEEDVYPDAIDEVEVDEVKISLNGRIQVEGYRTDEAITVYTADGQLIYSGTIAQTRDIHLQQGVLYVLRIREKSFKVMP
jgi:hypothetical protein